jgi:hypothetical protein
MDFFYGRMFRKIFNRRLTLIIIAANAALMFYKNVRK